MDKKDFKDDQKKVLNMRSLFRRIQFPAQLISISYIKNNTASIYKNNNYLDFCFEIADNRNKSSIFVDSQLHTYVLPSLWIRTHSHVYSQPVPTRPRDTLVFSYDSKIEDFFRKCAGDIISCSYVMTPHMMFILNDILVKIENCMEFGVIDRLDFLSFEFIFECILNSRSANPVTSDENKWKLMISIAGYIDQHINQQINLNDLCIRFAISRRVLFRYWKKHFNSTPSAYIAFRRMQLASYLILNTDLKLFEIVEKSGYASQAYFCAEFKKRNGMSPLEYRKKNSLHKSDTDPLDNC